MRRYRRKHRESDFIETAVADWGDTVYRVALNQTGSPTDAEDVRQDVFERLLTSAPSFADSEHLKAWLLRVTMNRCHDLAKSHSRSRTDLLEDHSKLMQEKLTSLSEEDEYTNSPLADELACAIRRCPTTSKPPSTSSTATTSPPTRSRTSCSAPPALFARGSIERETPCARL